MNPSSLLHIYSDPRYRQVVDAYDLVPENQNTTTNTTNSTASPSAGSVNHLPDVFRDP